MATQKRRISISDLSHQLRRNTGRMSQAHNGVEKKGRDRVPQAMVEKHNRRLIRNADQAIREFVLIQNSKSE